MKFLTHSLVLLLLAVMVTLGDDPSQQAAVKAISENEPVEKPPTTTDKPTSTTTKAPPPPTTSTLPPTTPSPPPTTPSPPPTTSTLPPTTHTPPTTPATPPTTPPTPPTTAPPTPAPKPPTDWFVKDNGTGTVCIIANMVLKISVPYKTKENKTVHAGFSVSNVANATADGTCGKENQTLVLSWPNVTASFSFAENKNDSTYSLSVVELTILVNNDTFVNSTMVNVTSVSMKHVVQVFSVPKNHSYTCSNVEPLALVGYSVSNGSATLNGTLAISNAHVEAFSVGESPKYGAPMDCATAHTPDIVPIAVGLILAGLVVVVLIAYLVGRRRAQARGYLSM